MLTVDPDKWKSGVEIQISIVEELVILGKDYCSEPDLQSKLETN